MTTWENEKCEAHVKCLHSMAACSNFVEYHPTGKEKDFSVS